MCRRKVGTSGLTNSYRHLGGLLYDHCLHAPLDRRNLVTLRHRGFLQCFGFCSNSLRAMREISDFSAGAMFKKLSWEDLTHSMIAATGR